jgi:hypothetical protein
MNVTEGYEGLLTKGKIYRGEEDEMFYHSVSNDRGGNKDKYLKCHDELDYISPWVIFIKLENWREIRIKELGI